MKGTANNSTTFQKILKIFLECNIPVATKYYNPSGVDRY